MVAIATVARIKDALRRADPHDVMAVLPGLINEIGPSLHQLPPQRQRIATGISPSQPRQFAVTIAVRSWRYAVSIMAEPIEEHKESGVILDLTGRGHRLNNRAAILQPRAAAPTAKVAENPVVCRAPRVKQARIELSPSVGRVSSMMEGGSSVKR